MALYIISRDMVKLLDFWAIWCGPCKFMEPIIEELEKELAGKVEIEKINVDEKQEFTQQNGVMSIPTYIVMKDDQEVERIVGATSKENLVKAISAHV